MWNLEKWYWWTYLQSRNRDTDIENKSMDTKDRRGWGMNWEIGTDIYIHTAAAAAAKSLQLCPTLCDPIDGSPPGSLVPGILQARTLEWVAISFSSAWKWSRSVVSNSSDPMDCSLPGSSVCIKYITNENLLYSTGNSTQCSMVT